MTKKVFTLYHIRDSIIDKEGQTPKGDIKMKVRMLKRPSGTSMVNQLVINEGRKTWFQSYDSTIIEIDRELQKITVGCDWDYSITTTRCLKQFLNEEMHWSSKEVDEFKKKLRKAQSSDDNIFVFNNFSIIYDKDLR